MHPFEDGSQQKRHLAGYVVFVLATHARLRFIHFIVKKIALSNRWPRKTCIKLHNTLELCDLVRVYCIGSLWKIAFVFWDYS